MIPKKRDFVCVANLKGCSMQECISAYIKYHGFVYEDWDSRRFSELLKLFRRFEDAHYVNMYPQGIHERHLGKFFCFLEEIGMIDREVCLYAEMYRKVLVWSVEHYAIPSPNIFVFLNHFIADKKKTEVYEQEKRFDGFDGCS